MSRQEFAAATGVSRETLERLQAYHDLLRKWTDRINLVAAGTVEDAWKRHFLDSAQLMRLSPEGGKWLDAGSGAGFPGAVIAIMAAEERPDLRITLVESDQRKAAFLRAVSRETGVPFMVLGERIEDVAPQAADVISARALAPLNALLDHAERHIAPKGVALFMKGAKADIEVGAALDRWRFRCEKIASVTDPEAVILKIGDIERV